MISLRVNGDDRQFDGDPNMPLLWYLRDELGLTGTKYGCGAGLCGACTVHVDGEATRSCMIAMADAEGVEVTTIEGLSPDGIHPVQVAWRELNVPQCGFCQAGQIMQAAAPARRESEPDRSGDPRRRMSGNICRCGCYQRIVAAVRHACDGSMSHVALSRPAAPAPRLAGAPHSRTSAAAASSRESVSGVGLARRHAGLPFSALARSSRYPTGGASTCRTARHDPLVFVAIAPDGTVTIVAHRSEMGTGSRTTLPMVIADEMEADWARVKIVQAAGRRAEIRQPGHRRLALRAPPHPADAPDRRHGPVHAGAGRGRGVGRRPGWSPRMASRAGPDGEVVHRSATGKTLGFGELAERRHGVAVPDVRDAGFKDETEFRYIGKGDRADLRPARHHHRQGASMAPTSRCPA